MTTKAAYVASRLLVLVAAVIGAQVLPRNVAQQTVYGLGPLTHAFGGVAAALLASLTRWDGIWYLLIAHTGYSGPHGVPTAEATGAAWSGAAAFFPLYPLVVRVASGFDASPRALIVAGSVVSLAAFALALRVFHELARLELGDDAARVAVVLLAFFPGSLFFSAPYSESLFLLLSVSSFWYARAGRWPLAAICAFLAAGTRPVGILLLVPLLLLAREAGERRAVAWCLLVPAGVVAYGTYLAAVTGDFFAFAHAQNNWFSQPGNPLLTAGRAVAKAATGLADLIGGDVSGPAARIAVLQVVLLPFLALALAAVVGAFRRLPLAYAAYAACSVLVALSARPAFQPLESLPRFLAVCFPAFMWLAVVLVRHRRATAAAVIGCAALLAVATAQFAAWEWIGA